MAAIDLFDNQTEDFPSYQESLEIFFSENKIHGHQKVLSLISLIGSNNYIILKKLCHPAEPIKKSYDQLVLLLKLHFSLQKNIIKERCIFNSRIQRDNESVSDFIAELKRIGDKCDFMQFFEEAIRDRLIVGVKDKNLQKQFLEVSDLTLDHAIDIATAYEESKEYYNKIISNSNNQQIREKNSFSGTCLCCGMNDHSVEHCNLFPNIQCFLCKKKGHATFICYERKKRDCESVKNIGSSCINENSSSYLIASSSENDQAVRSKTESFKELDYEAGSRASNSDSEEDFSRSDLLHARKKTKRIFKYYKCTCVYLNCESRLPKEKREYFFNYFNSIESWQKQTRFIVNTVKVIPVQKRCSLTPVRQFSRRYTIDGIQVCKSVYIATLSISNSRIDYALRVKSEGGIREKELGKRKPRKPVNLISTTAERTIKRFLDTFPKYESDSSRNKNHYFDPELTIDKLHSLYSQYVTEKARDPSLHVDYAMFIQQFQIYGVDIYSSAIDMSDVE